MLINRMDVRNARANQSQANYEDDRWQTYMKDVRNQHESELAQLKTDTQKEIDAETKLQKQQLEDLRKDYKVEITRTKESLEKDLIASQKSHETALKTEQDAHE